MNFLKMDLIETLIFQGPKGQTMVKSGYFATFWQFYQKRTDNVSLYFAYSFLGIILIDCQEVDFIELLERSFSRSEKSGLAHCPMLHKCIASCSFFVVKPVLS